MGKQMSCELNLDGGEGQARGWGQQEQQVQRLGMLTTQGSALQEWDPVSAMLQKEKGLQSPH